LLLLLALLLFGAKRLPEIGRSLGTGMREFKDSVSGGSSEITTQELAPLAAVISPGSGNGQPIVSRLDYEKIALARLNRWYVFPLSASYTVRMQSNFYRKHLQN